MILGYFLTYICWGFASHPQIGDTDDRIRTTINTLIFCDTYFKSHKKTKNGAFKT